jgi:hypothetical protein
VLVPTTPGANGRQFSPTPGSSDFEILERLAGDTWP